MTISTSTVGRMKVEGRPTFVSRPISNVGNKIVECDFNVISILYNNNKVILLYNNDKVITTYIDDSEILENWKI